MRPEKPCLLLQRHNSPRSPCHRCTSEVGSRAGFRRRGWMPCWGSGRLKKQPKTPFSQARQCLRTARGASFLAVVQIAMLGRFTPPLCSWCRVLGCCWAPWSRSLPPPAVGQFLNVVHATGSVPRTAYTFATRAAFWPSPRWTGVTPSTQMHLTYAASACSLTPSARATLSTVAKLGFPSALRARYRLSRLSPASLATCVIPFARAMSPSALAIPAASSGSSWSQASRYAAISSGVRSCSATS